MMSLTLTLPSFNDSSNVSCELQLMSAATSMSNLKHDVAAFFSNQEMLNWLDQVNKRKNNGTCQNWGQVGPKIFVKRAFVSNRGCIILYREGIVLHRIKLYRIVPWHVVMQNCHDCDTLPMSEQQQIQGKNCGPAGEYTPRDREVVGLKPA